MYSCNIRNTFKSQIVAVVHALWKVDEKFRDVLSTSSKESLPWAAEEMDEACEVLRAEREASEKIDLDLACEIAKEQEEEMRRQPGLWPPGRQILYKSRFGTFFGDGMWQGYLHSRHNGGWQIGFENGSSRYVKDHDSHRIRFCT